MVQLLQHIFLFLLDNQKQELKSQTSTDPASIRYNSDCGTIFLNSC